MVFTAYSTAIIQFSVAKIHFAGFKVHPERGRQDGVGYSVVYEQCWVKYFSKVFWVQVQVPNQKSI